MLRGFFYACRWGFDNPTWLPGLENVSGWRLEGGGSFPSLPSLIYGLMPSQLRVAQYFRTPEVCTDRHINPPPEYDHRGTCHRRRIRKKA